jgi:DNA-binding beta-propeller fold protein YncE
MTWCFYVLAGCGNASNQLVNPYGIALHPISGELYIADYANHRLISYAAGSQNGTVLLGGNGPGSSNTQLWSPLGLSCDLFSNSLIVAHYSRNQIVRYVLGATNWTLMAGNANGASGSTSSSLFAPMDVVLDPMGNLYVTDRYNHRIQFFPAGQMNGTTIAGRTGVFGSNATTLNLPCAAKIDSQLNLYVADTENHRIQKFLRY